MVTCKVCEWMHSVSEESCPMCGSTNADRKALSRRKRKNKERQLKHTIARLYKERDKEKSRGDALLEEFVKANQRIIFLEMKLALDIRHNKKR